MRPRRSPPPPAGSAHPRRPLQGLLLALLLPLSLGACGQNRYAPPSAPLGPEHYVIAPDDVPDEGQHMRYAAAAPGQAGGLDIAVTEYRHPDRTAPVTLFGVVHIADALYFDAVQRELDAYGTVLYEGVKPEHQSTEAFAASFNEKGGEAAALQKQLAGWFGFEFQMTALDYTRQNFVHADMSLEDFLEAGGDKFMPDPDMQAELEENLGKVTGGVRSTWDAVKRLGDVALGAPGPLRSLGRMMFAKTMGTLDIGQALSMQPGFSELILTERNKVVIERLEEVAPGKVEPIAIFYGAAHMDDLEERLINDLGYRRVKAHWLRAWALRPSLK